MKYPGVFFSFSIYHGSQDKIRKILVAVNVLKKRSNEN